MSKQAQTGQPWAQGPPQMPPPSYSEVLGGVAPASPFQAPQGAHMISGPPIVTTVIPVGPTSTRMICPSCHGEISTATQTKPGNIAYLSGFIIALLGGWCGCCLIPCCIDDCMDVHHNCPQCGSYLGRFRR